MSGLITMVTEFFFKVDGGGVGINTGILTLIPKLTEKMIADPLLVLPFVVLVCGLVVGIIARLVSIR